jgi:hypothetical protein
MAAFTCYRPGRLPKLCYSHAPDAWFTQEEFGPLLTDLHQALGGRVIVVWDQLPGHVSSGIHP